MVFKGESPNDYISQIPEERQEVVKKLCKVIRDNLPEGFEEGLNYNMIGFYVPHSLYPDGYHCNPELPLPFVNIASKKNFIAIYHMGMYAKKEILEWFSDEYPKHCRYKLDIGKSCIRFKKIHDIPFKLIGQLMKKMTAKQWIETYEHVYKK